MNVRQPKSSRYFVRQVLAWYAKHGRVLPWRDCADPYHILLSEIMLQQTQVSRVLVKHPEFLTRFPSLESLAGARQRDVVIAWQGMGYNNRAVRLHLLARQMIREHGGNIPASYEALTALPGIGRYTASALLCSVHKADVPVVDINVRRLLSRFFWRQTALTSIRPEAKVWDLAGVLVPEGRGYAWSQALMDLGATVCTARQPLCDTCPLASRCLSRRSMRPLARRKASGNRKRLPVPDRIYRGRLIDQLRHKSRGTTVEVLGRAIRDDFGRRDAPWIKTLLNGLIHDGLIVVHGAAPFLKRRVVLA